jgi:uncharacterized protein
MKNNNMTIIGREAELATLSEAMESNQSEFVAVYGRRRVGKTFLIKQALKNEICFELTGIQNATKQEQLSHFYTVLTKYSGKPKKIPKPRNWIEAFDLLRYYIETNKTKKKKVIFFDEMPWLATQKSGFLNALDYFWNSWASWTGDVMLIICGSAASWIIEKIVNNRGGLHNRLTKRIRLMPFNLYETQLFLQSRQINYNKYQLLQLYMTMGGIPHYLKEIKRGVSVAENINNCCFIKDGLLFKEFDNLYKALFDNATHHITVIRCLAKKQKGLTRNDIVALTKISSGGTISTVLNELLESGFIAIQPPFENKSKDSLYRLTDEYSLFYLKFIEKNNSNVKGTWLKIMNTPGYKVWCGFAFESLCLKHIEQIKNALGISGILTTHASWLYKSADGGVQIDLLIDRVDGVINICEMKFAKDAYTVTKAYEQQLRNKVGIFTRITKTKKSTILTFITTYGVTVNMHSLSVVDAQLTMEILFKS